MINSKRLKQLIGTKTVIHTVDKEESLELIRSCYELGLKLRNKKILENSINPLDLEGCKQ